MCRVCCEWNCVCFWWERVRLLVVCSRGWVLLVGLVFGFICWGIIGCCWLVLLVRFVCCCVRFCGNVDGKLLGGCWCGFGCWVGWIFVGWFVGYLVVCWDVLWIVFCDRYLFGLLEVCVELLLGDCVSLWVVVWCWWSWVCCDLVGCLVGVGCWLLVVLVYVLLSVRFNVFCWWSGILLVWKIVLLGYCGLLGV